MGKPATHIHTLTAPGRKGGGSYHVTTEHVQIIPHGDGLLVRPDPYYFKGYGETSHALGFQEGSAKAQAHREATVRQLMQDATLMEDILRGTNAAWRRSRAWERVWFVLFILATCAAVWGWAR